MNRSPLPSSGLNRYAALDGWRGLCALMVALFHFEAAGTFRELALVRYSFRFVDFFFVLSGFVICHAYNQRIRGGASLWRFLWQRIGRLWPLHVVTLALMIGIESSKWLLARNSSLDMATAAFAPGSASSPWAILTNLLFFHAFGIHGQLTWNFPSWSIAVEFWTCVVFGCVMAFGGRWKWSLLSIAALASVSVLVWHSPAHPMEVGEDFGLFRCLYGFVAGALTWRLAKANWSPRVSERWATMLELTCVLITGAFIVVAADRIGSLAAPLVFAGVVLIFSQEQGSVSRWLLSRPLQWLGNRSYSVYMVHALILAVVMRGAKTLQNLTGQTLLRDGHATPLLDWGVPWQADIAALAYLTAVIGFAALTYRFVEEPARTWFRSRSAPAESGRNTLAAVTTPPQG